MHAAISKKVVIVNSRSILESKGTLGIVVMSDNATCEDCFCMAVTLMIKLRSILCKVNAYSNKLCALLEPHSFFRFQYRVLIMTTFFEIVVHIITHQEKWQGSLKETI